LIRYQLLISVGIDPLSAPDQWCVIDPLSAPDQCCGIDPLSAPDQCWY